MVSMNTTLKKGYWFFAALGAAYVLFMVALCTPWLQRQALYAHKFVTAFWVDLDAPERYGFADHQVTPFDLSTPDGETLYCWHVMPLQLYAQHEHEIHARSAEPTTDFTKTIAFELLKADPDSRLVINYHGNAGNLGQGYRTQIYLSLTSTSPHTHVLTCDYRGYGRSTGQPTEAGLITDGIAIAAYARDVLAISEQHIALMGQSLGTAVSTAVALAFAEPSLVTKAAFSSTSASEEQPLFPPGIAVPASFAGKDVVGRPFSSLTLIAPFASIPALMHTYRVLGLIPILSPLRPYPTLQRLVTSYILDTWPTDQRMRALVQSLSSAGHSLGDDGRRRLVQIIHARDDFDIPHHQALRVFEAAADAIGSPEEGERVTKAVKKGARGRLGKVENDGVSVEIEMVKYGGHNRINTFAPVALAIMRALRLD